MLLFSVPVLGIVAYSGTGKTTLLEKLIHCLKTHGYRVAAIKHSHHDFEIDKKGKDSDRLRAAGAEQIIIASQYRTALIIEEDRHTEPDLFKQIKRLEHDELDLILVEGFRQFAFPKMEIHRPSLEKPLLCNNDDTIVALICDDEPATKVNIPLLPLNDPESICQKIIKDHLS